MIVAGHGKAETRRWKASCRAKM